MKYFFTVFLLLGLFFNIHAQNAKIDSLQRELEKTGEDTMRVNILNILSKSYYSIDIEQMGEYSRKSIELASKLNFNKGLMQAYNSMGIYYDLKGEIDNAFESYEKELNIGFLLGDIQSKYRVRQNMAALYNKKGNYEKAIELYTLNIKENNTENLTKANSYLNLGNSFSLKADYELSVSNYFEALKIYEKLNHLKGQIQALNNLGIVHLKIKNYAKAIDYYSKVGDIAKKNGFVLDIVVSKYNIGTVYAQKEEQKNAKTFFVDALQGFQKVNDLMGQGLCYSSLSIFYRKEKNYRDC